MKHLKFTSKITALFLTMVLLLSLAAGVAALSPGDPCLLYGNDPDKGDMYETYGDTYFLDKIPVKTPSGQLFIALNNKTVQNMIKAAEKAGEDSLDYILTEYYFPELDIESIYCDMLRSDIYEMSKESYFEINDLKLYVTIILKDNSKESLTKALVTLAPRSDIDIVSVVHQSYDLNDVTSALKYISGWSSPDNNYRNVYHDINRDGKVKLNDVTGMLKVIAGWNIKDILGILE